MWRAKGSDYWNTGTGLQECKDVIEFFETVSTQPERWVVTSLVEITKEQYDIGKARGIIG